MSLTAFRLTFRMYRFAIVGTGFLGIALSTLAAWYSVRLDGFSDAVDCIRLGGDLCRPYLGVHEEASRVLTAAMFLPIVPGLFLGVPIVAQELERSTTPIAWSLDPSRWRWFADRSIPIIAMVVLVGLLVGTAANYLEMRLFPFADPSASFHDFDMRGPIVAARMLLALGCGVLIGALVGRTLIAMLMTLAISTVVTIGVSTSIQAIQAREAVPVADSTINEGFAGRQVDFRYELPSGELMTWEQLQARFPDPALLDRQLTISRQLVYVIPADHYTSASVVEAATTSGLGLSLVAASLFSVGRRQPQPGRIRFGFPRITLRRKRHRVFRAVGPVGHVGVGTVARLVLWPHRLELVAGAAVGLLVSVGCVLVVGSLGAISPPADCLRDLANIPATPECATVDQFLEVGSEWGNKLFVSMAVLPWIVGALIGVVLIGREIEQGTATLAWSLEPDRRRWVITRVIVGAVLVTLLLIVPATLANEMQRIARPWIAPQVTFDNYGLRGPLIVMRGLAAFSIALLVGAYLGRIVSGLLLASALCVGLVLTLGLLWPFGQPFEAAAQSDPGLLGAVPGNPQTIPGDRLLEVELRESIFLAGASLLLVAATTVVVERRRP